MAPAAIETDSSSATTPLLLLCATTTTVVVISLFFLVRSRIKNPKQAGRLPPGPPALLFVAKFIALRRSIFDLAPLLRDMHARYGPVVSLRLGRTLVFVADRHVAHRLLIQGGSTFDDRPPPVDPAILFSAGGRDIMTSPYGAYWRLLRRNLAGEALHPSRVALFAPARRWACDGLIHSLHAAAGGGGEDAAGVVTLRPFLRRAVSELLVYMCFGARLGEDAMDEIEGLQRRVLLTGLTTFPVFAFFPWVTKRLFRRRWEANVAVRRRQDELFLPLIHAASRDSPPCYAESLRELRVPDEEGGDDRPLTDAEMVSLCSEFLNGGMDTTMTLVEWIMAELVNQPDVQAKLREEVVRSSTNGVVQVEEPPPTMPYLKAVVLEGLRLHPPGHFVLPHGVRGDGGADVGGYAVPGGAEVNFLVTEIARSETVWTAATEFRPDRFLDGGDGCDFDITGSREIKMMPFGVGRRMCPAYSLGIHHTEYFVARLVQEFEWQPPVDGVAVDMAEQLEITVVMKQPLRARIVARH